ncbi:TrmO family methyltransferase domain-containing protein [Taibaiella soli]|uniref:TrmO family methyltransferase domain-containing protein n=1 Tax=Taibaiella soli TaxID=1649169 RepID=UPI003742E842
MICFHKGIYGTRPIGFVSNDRKRIQEDYWDNVVSILKINTKKYGEDCLNSFSHLGYKNRPNLVGLSRCSILTVTNDSVAVRGLNAINGSPILDIKHHICDNFLPLVIWGS